MFLFKWLSQLPRTQNTHLKRNFNYFVFEG